MIRFYIFLFIAIIILQTDSRAFPFEKRKVSGIKEYIEFHVNIENIDNNEGSDLFICGKSRKSSGCTIFSELYYFQGPSSFISSGISLQPVKNGSSVFWDFDHDGDGDLIYSGLNSQDEAVLCIYRNDDGNYSRQNHSIPTLSFCEFFLTDSDQDGRFELIYTGINELKSVSYYQIRWYDEFTFQELDLPQLFPARLSFFDINLDGSIDLFLTGTNSQGRNVNQVYQNNKSIYEMDNRFSDPQLKVESLKPFDMDGDGDWDLVFSARTRDDGPITGVFYNQPTGFLDFHYQALSSLHGKIITADFNNDGRPDLFNWGQASSLDTKTLFFLNQGDHQFQKSSIDLQLEQANFLQGDYNQDKKPDIIVFGLDSLNAFSCHLLLNTSTTTQSSPILPDTIHAPEITRQWIELSSSYASDDGTDTLSLLYQYRLGTKEAPDRVISSHLSHQAASLIKPSLFHRFYQTISPGKYQTQVRILDQSGNYSPWSSPLEFHIYSFIPSGEEYEGIHKGKIKSADMDHDGDFDLLVNGFNDKNEPSCQILTNEKGILKTYATLPGTGFGNIDAFDLDKDSYPDIIVTGSMSPETGAGPEKTILYKNNGASFTEENLKIYYVDSTSNELPQLYESYSAFEYLDQDVYPELIICGAIKKNSNQLPRFYIFTYLGDNEFRAWEDHGIPGFKYGGFDVGDLNNDGMKDIIVCGLTSGSSHQLIPATRLYVQKEEGGFRELNTDMEDLQYSSQVDLFDFDNDGDLDVFICGGKSLQESYTLIHENQYPLFPLRQSVSKTFAGDIQAVDYNQDCSPDLISTGWSIDAGSSGAGISTLYRQTDGIFEQDTLSILPGLYWSACEWRDFDGDGGPDLAICGMDNDGKLDLNIYANAHFSEETVFPPPSPPSVSTEISRDSLFIQWEKGIDNRNQSREGLAYFFEIISENGIPSYLSSPLPFPVQKTKLFGLKDGTYTLKAYTRNNALRFSDDTVSASFYIDTTPPELSEQHIPQVTGIGPLRCSFYFSDVSSLHSTYPIQINLYNSDLSIPFQISSSSSNIVEGEVIVPDSLPSGYYHIQIIDIADSRENTLSAPIEAGSLYVDTEKPEVMKTIPLPNQSHFSTYSPIKLFFNRKIAPLSVDEHFRVTDEEGSIINGQITFHEENSSHVLVFEPGVRLTHNTRYQILLGTSIKDTLGNPLKEETVIPFQTAGLTQPSSGTNIIGADSSYSLYIPPFAINQDIEISFIEKDTLQDDNIEFYHTPFEILPELDFDNPATLTFYKNRLSYPANSRVFRWDSTAWTTAGSNGDENEFSVPIYKTGIYALGIPLNPQETVLDMGEDIVINPRIYDPGSTRKPTLDISFFLETSKDVSIYIYNVEGRPIKTVKDNANYSSGNHTIRWNGRDAAGKNALPGLYIAVVKAGAKIRKKTFVIQPHSF